MPAGALDTLPPAVFVTASVRFWGLNLAVALRASFISSRQTVPVAVPAQAPSQFSKSWPSPGAAVSVAHVP